MKKIYTGLMASLILTVAGSCNKYLDIKPKDKVVPATVNDFNLLFANLIVMNVTSSLGNISDDDISLTDAQYAALFIPFTRPCYTWSKDIFTPSDEVKSWGDVYKKIYYANTVLEGLPSTTTGSAEQRQQLRGAALFYKSAAFFDLVRTFAKQYDAATAATDLGIPLRDEADINVPVKRATVQQVYDRVLKDLDEAASLLPNIVPQNTSPVKAAAFALTARVYLQMGNYDQALVYADKSLQLQSTLVNYNKYSASATSNNFGIPAKSNPEILYLSVGAELIYGPQCNITPAFLEQHFPDGDMRRELFFRKYANGTIRFVGNYHDFTVWTGPLAFVGPTTAEMLLIRAECKARKNDINGALQDLNSLRVNRIKPAQYQQLTAATADAALHLALEERRKELIFRNIRWYDLQRLNKDPKLAITLTRTVKGETFTLPPNDPRYVMPIPANVIQISNMPQNPR